MLYCRLSISICLFVFLSMFIHLSECLFVYIPMLPSCGKFVLLRISFVYNFVPIFKIYLLNFVKIYVPKNSRPPPPWQKNLYPLLINTWKFSYLSVSNAVHRKFSFLFFLFRSIQYSAGFFLLY